jgi:hypothetical protein
MQDSNSKNNKRHTQFSLPEEIQHAENVSKFHKKSYNLKQFKAQFPSN